MRSEFYDAYPILFSDFLYKTYVGGSRLYLQHRFYKELDISTLVVI